MEYYQGLGVEKLSAAKRLDLAERDIRDHAKSLTGLIDGQGLLAKRITELEEAHQQRVIYEVREEQRDIALNLRLTSIESKLGKIEGAGSRLLWIVGGSVVAAFMAFLLSGGLTQ